MKQEFKEPIVRKDSSGYITISRIRNRVIDILFSALFILLSLPILAFLLPFIVVLNGRPVFYSGIRYGKNKKTFVMYKFRTLPVSFEKQKDGKLVSYEEHRQLPWFSRFLRDSRLDELPQLINILKGDMTFIGPRPERPSVYRELCGSIKDYDKRFKVEPGMIGYSQLFTPHSTPKRIRAFIDNKASRYEKNLLFGGYVILITIYAVLEKTTRMLSGFIVQRLVKIRLLKRYNDKRGLDRVNIQDGLVFGCTSTEPAKECMIDYAEVPFGALVDMNEEYCRIDTDMPLKDTCPRLIRLVTTRNSAVCTATIYRKFQMPQGSYTYILRYEPISDLNSYFIDQYFLKKSLMRYVL